MLRSCIVSFVAEYVCSVRRFSDSSLFPGLLHRLRRMITLNTVLTMGI